MIRARSAGPARVVLLVAVILLAGAATARAAQPGDADFQRADRSVAAVPAPATAARRDQRARMGPLGLLQVASRSGGVRTFGRLDGLLTAASSRPAPDIALDYVRARPALFGLDAGDLSALRIVRRYSAGAVEHVRWAQSYAGIDAIDTSLTANLTSSGRLINVLGEPRHDLRLTSVTPQVTANDAYARAAQPVGGARSAVKSSANGPQRETRFADGGSAKLVIYEGGGPRLGWRLLLEVDSTHVYDVVVDATTGVVERRRNLVREATARIYRNHPGAAAGGSPQDVAFDAYLDPGATRLFGPDAHTFTDSGDVVTGPSTAAPPAGDVGRRAATGSTTSAIRSPPTARRCCASGTRPSRTRGRSTSMPTRRSCTGSCRTSTIT